MGEYVGTTVRYDGAPSLSKAPNKVNERILGYASLMIRSFFICLLAGIRIRWGNPSAFDNKSVFTNSSIAASIGVFAIFFCLLVAQSPRSRPIEVEDNSYTTFLKFIGSFLAFLGPFSLLMVIVLPPELNWIGYLVACVMFGIIVTCFCLDDQQNIRPSTCNDLAIYVILFLTSPSILFDTSLDWIVYRVICVCLWMENAYHLITYLMFIYDKTRKPKADQLIPQDENNNHPPSHLSYLMPLGISPV